MNKIISRYRKSLQPLEGVLLFIGITLVIHYAYRYWAITMHYYPVRETVDGIQDWLSGLAFRNTSTILRFMGFEFDGLNNTITFKSGSWLAVNRSCSGFKQYLQAFFLFIIYPGRLKHKLWFIPLALAVMYLMNIIRLTGVSIVLYYYPDWWEISHDYIFRFLFYFVLFLLWIWWEEKFRPLPGNKNNREQ